MIITIDGPVATGKSTIAKKLAESLGFIYFDTGAMYRALTYALIKHKINFDDLEELRKFLERFTFNIRVHRGEKHYFVDNEDVTLQIRRSEVTNQVSKIAAIPLVREKLVAIQRELSNGVNAVFEGRDMGTVVFPNASLKIFLTGSPEIRAKRRFEELISKFPEMKETLTMQQVLEEITQRDIFDSTRENSPLKQAEDAFLVDTTGLTPDEVVFHILECKDQLKKR